MFQGKESHTHARHLKCEPDSCFKDDRHFYILKKRSLSVPKKILCMTIEEIIRMLENPATFGDTVIEAAKLPFRGDHKVMFQQKKQRYISELSDYELSIWIGEMKIL